MRLADPMLTRYGVLPASCALSVSTPISVADERMGVDGGWKVAASCDAASGSCQAAAMPGTGDSKDTRPNWERDPVCRGVGCSSDLIAERRDHSVIR